jgi:hypothetical protein
MAACECHGDLDALKEEKKVEVTEEERLARERPPEKDRREKDDGAELSLENDSPVPGAFAHPIPEGL